MLRAVCSLAYHFDCFELLRTVCATSINLPQLFDPKHFPVNLFRQLWVGWIIQHDQSVSISGILAAKMK
jgi:hypothetical protein